MGRFYDVLRQAGRLPANPEEQNRETSQKPPEALEETSQLLTPTGEGGALHGAGLLPEELTVASVEEGVLSSLTSPRNGTLGTTVKVALDRKARVIPNSPDSALVEHYRLLRTQVLQHQQQRLFKSLLITSPRPQEGKTVTTLNLALTFAMLPGCKVVVVEGDLRRGSLRQWLGAESGPGFGNLIEGSAKLEEVLRRSEEIPVHFILRGDFQVPAAELLHSPRLEAHIQNLKEHYDLVLVDSPPVNMVTDAQLLAASCDAVLLVARVFATSCKALAEAQQTLSPHRLLGTVLNGGTNLASYRRYRSYYGERR